MSSSSCLAALLGQLRDEVGGVVGLHLVEHVGGAVVVELGEDVDLLALGHLLEHVGEAVVGELLGDLDACAAPAGRAGCWRGRRASGRSRWR